MTDPIRPPHIPVMGEEILKSLEGRHVSVVADGTLGAGGHARLLLEAHPEIELYFGGDQDPTALALAEERLADLLTTRTVRFTKTNFETLPGILEREQIRPTLILLDLGVSSMQLDRPERGFSFQADGPLDMRMDPTGPCTAEEIVMSWPEEKLRTLFWEYGEESRGRQAARAIVEARRKQQIATTAQLVEVLGTVLPRRGPLHPCTKIFQALRLAVNDELTVLERALPALAKQLAPEGLLMVISFHSLEDRIVKWCFRSIAAEGGYEILTKKPMEPSLEETRRNRRSRSAKLRILVRTSS